VIGAGGIVETAHLPAYAKAGFTVAGVYDIEPGRGPALAAQWGIGAVYVSLQEAAAQPGVVFDVAVPPAKLPEVLQGLPDGAVVLMQKPMGADLAQAREIRQLCRDKKLTAAVNFQLRFSPMMLALRDIFERGLLGDLTDIEIRLNLRTPWELFGFLKGAERVEIQAHSVHYLDWIRSLLGEPNGVYARTLADARYPDLASTRTSAILDYGDSVRCCLSLNHNYPFGPQHAAAMVKVEGTRGAAVARLGLLLNYPEGEPDLLEFTTGDTFAEVPLNGRWFPDAFIGTMASLQRFAAGEADSLPTSVEDAYFTMALVEACYLSSAHGATPIPQ
jgi:predicted dehydrogenase